MGWLPSVTRVSAVVLVAGAVLFGCQPPRSEPFLALSGPKDLTSLAVRDAHGEVVWSIEADEPKTISSIYYGVVPEGFTQTTPRADTLPRDLVDREVLITTTTTLRREFTHYGFARGPQGFQVNHSEMKNLPREVAAGNF